VLLTQVYALVMMAMKVTTVHSSLAQPTVLRTGVMVYLMKLAKLQMKTTELVLVISVLVTVFAKLDGRVTLVKKSVVLLIVPLMENVLKEPVLVIRDGKENPVKSKNQTGDSSLLYVSSWQS